MALLIETRFVFTLDQPTDVLLQFEAAALPEQRILSSSTQMSDSEHCARVAAQDDIGERLWIRANGSFAVDYRAEVETQRQIADLSALTRLQPHDMPGEAVQYLFDSRYCTADKFQPFADAEFGGTDGGARIEAIRSWIANNFTYQPGVSDARTTALDSFVERRGICRDYAHVLVTLARASTIPARFVSCYAPDVEPQDFHAVAEVFLTDPETQGGGTWQLVDATGMANPAETVKIGVGRDAADVSFLTSFGASSFGDKTVSVTRTGS
ncbi:transglutaminase-like domain-containing protein [Qipengyuania marisflavi]|uniref:Transglutaminase family protein n=1 Tax=Qipengyuania marisflavi TaxID=2486356 RepID=A0A5S3P3E3_9SPHN|nr:transglutaminase family protein [Qipengyuania marisflavi]TMM47376.1 transglutaminase family protein [Qipengyuania marisflavi]